MNSALAKDIEREFLVGEESERIQDAVTLESEGIIEIFVRNGRHQKTSLPLRAVLKSEDEPRLLGYSSYEDMVKTVSKTVCKFEKEIDHGYLILSYRAHEKGEISHLNLKCKMEISHNKKNKK